MEMIPGIYRVPGMTFHPSDERLISGYLLPKVMGQKLPFNVILECNLYGAAPWEVFRDVDESSWHWQSEGNNPWKKHIYVFTKLAKVGVPNSRGIARTAGCGTWVAQTCAKMIKSSLNGQVIGSRKMFSFEPQNKELAAGFGRWNMHEYSLENNDHLQVLCKIIWTKSKDGRPRPAEDENKRKRVADEGLEEDGRRGQRLRTDNHQLPDLNGVRNIW